MEGAVQRAVHCDPRLMVCPEGEIIVEEPVQEFETWDWSDWDFGN